MPVFVHLTPHSSLPAIRRAGIRARRGSGVFALPVTPNFYVSHQWLRELRRSGGGTIVAVYFRIPDDQPVAIGHFGGARLEMTAAEAVAVMLGAEANDPAQARAADAARDKRRRRRDPQPRLPTSPEGYEVVVPRAIAASEILRVKTPPQVVGWRYSPGAHERPPCVCICCERGAYGLQKLVRRAAEAEVDRRPKGFTLFQGGSSALDRAVRQAERRKGARKGQG